MLVLWDLGNVFNNNFLTFVTGKQANIIVNQPAVEMENDACLPDEKDDISEEGIAANGIDVSQLVASSLPEALSNEEFQEIAPFLDEEMPEFPQSETSKKWDKEHQGLTWLAGRIARKFSDIHPDLGRKTSDYEPYEDIGDNTWLFTVSKGGLRAPSDDFIFDYERFNALFCHFHGKSANRGDRVLDKLVEILKHHFGDKYNDKLYQFFTKSRTHIRMTHMSLQAKEKPTKQGQKPRSKRYYTKMGHNAGI